MITNNYTLELWHSLYGLLRIQQTQSINEQIDTNGLPQGVYIVIFKQNGNPAFKTKMLIQ